MSNQQYLRYVIAFVTNPDGSMIVIQSERPDVDGQHIQFNTQAAMTASPKSCNFVCYNPSDDQLRIAQQEGATLTIFGGYLGIPGKVRLNNNAPSLGGTYTTSQIQNILAEDAGYLNADYPDNSISLIFSGNIIQTRKLIHNVVDTSLNITAVDSDVIMTSAWCNLSLKSGQTIIQQLNAINENAFNNLKLVKNSGITSVPTINTNTITSDTILHRGKTVVGPYYDVLRAYASNVSADAYFENGQPILLARDAVLNKDPIVLSPANGLIGLPIQTFDGILARCTLNNFIVRGSQVQLQNTLIQQQQVGTEIGAMTDFEFSATPILDGLKGNYKVLAVSHVGDTRGQDWYTDIVCFTYTLSAPQIGKYVQN